MTKKHFEAIAQILNSAIRSLEMWGHEMGTDDLVGLFADYLEKQNEHFDRDRFYKACYKEVKAQPLTK
jgi:hypothetical protein